VKIDARVTNFIEQRTGRKCGLVEAPRNANLPFYTLIPMPGAELYGDLANPNNIEEKIYQLDVVGTSALQTEEAEDRVCTSMGKFLMEDIPGVMGPPLIRKNGASRATDRVFHRVVIVRISVTEEEE
jgi:hypothetical protein